MKTASSDEELAFKQKEKDAQMQLGDNVGEASKCSKVLVWPDQLHQGTLANGLSSCPLSDLLPRW